MTVGETELRKHPGSPFTMAVLILLTLVMAVPLAQASDRYRAEFVILERIIAPENLAENMSGQKVDPTPAINKALWVTPEGGGPRSSLNQTNGLYLDSAAARLTNSGRFRILAKAGWLEDFPQDYRGEPLAVAVGDWLPQARQRDVEGYIKIDRKRFLHVEAHLNHWQDAASAAQPGAEAEPQLLTWIRETRRMRSSEIHFLDSPTIGVLVYFAKIED
jgi:hypothetical protein